jgi:hypothetical protein
VAHDVSGPADLVQRKQSRPTRARGKAGYRRLESVLEAANIVVQSVETENDIGRDAFVDIVDIVDGTDVTGGVICVQVKSGPSHFHDNQWVIPGKPADFTLWRESTVPVFGIVHDPDTDAVRWVNLSHAAALALDGYLSPVVSGPFGVWAIPVPDDNRLDQDLTAFLAAAETALRRRSGTPVAALLSDDVETVESGIADTFAVGRYDPTGFLLLASLFHRLPKSSRRFAVVTLAMTTSHPDVLWTKDNWIPERVSSVVRRRIRWNENDVTALLAEIDESGIDRGTIGQTVLHVLLLDNDILPKLQRVVLDRTVPDAIRLTATVILLYKAGVDAPEVLEHLVRSDESLGSDEGLFPVWRRLVEIDHFEVLAQTVDDFGYVSLF